MKEIVLLIVIIAFSDAQDTNSMQAAFTAGLSHHQVLNGGDVVKYDTVFTNIGNGYDSTTGMFTAPYTGIYVFQFHALSRTDKYVWLDLYHNYNYVTSAYGHTANDWASAGNNAILHLTKGDSVKVQSVEDQDSGPTELYGESGQVYCTFSGYLISPIFEETPVVG